MEHTRDGLIDAARGSSIALWSAVPLRLAYPGMTNAFALLVGR